MPRWFHLTDFLQRPHGYLMGPGFSCISLDNDKARRRIHEVSLALSVFRTSDLEHESFTLVKMLEGLRLKTHNSLICN